MFQSFTKNKITILSTLILLIIFLAPSLVFAGDTSYIQDIVFKIVVGVAGMLVWISGFLINSAITTFVVGFGDVYVSYGIGFAIDNLWAVVRDIFNLTFVFGLIFIGFKLILNSGDSSAKKMLGSLIMAALLVNFSLFITKFIVDFSNIAATQLATGFKNGAEYDVSDAFMRLMGINGLWSSNSIPTNIGEGQAWGYIFGTLILFIVCAFVFAAGGILLLIRFAVLNIYMVLSPIMFLGWVFPGFASTSHEYWNGFLKRAFFAPAYILMIYLSYQILVNMHNIRGAGGKFGDVLGGTYEKATSSFDTTVPFFVLTSIFLVASLVVAQKMGAQGASTALAVGKRWSGKAQQMATTATRKTVGVVTYAPKAYARNKVNKWGGNLEKGINNWQAGNGTVGKILKTNAVDRAFRGSAGAMQSAQLGTGTTRKAEDDYKAKTEARAKKTAVLNNGVNAKKQLEDTTLTLTPAERAVLEGHVKAMEDAVGSMSTSMLEEMTDDQLSAVSEFLTNSQTENLMKSDKLSDDQKGAIGKARQKAITKFLTVAGGIENEQITKLSIEQIETMDEKWINDNVGKFSTSQMADLKKSKKYTESKRNSFADKRKGDHSAVMASGRPNEISTLFEFSPTKRKKSEDIANLGASILLNPASIGFLEPADLEKIATKETLNVSERADLKRSIMDPFINTGTNATRLLNYFSSTHATRHW